MHSFDPILSKINGESVERMQNECIGSLLPFGSHVNLVMPGDIGHLIEHDSLKTWTIDVRGRVKMSQVGLLGPDVESCWVFNGPNPDDDWQHISLQYDVNLREYLDSYKPWMPNYAVTLVKPLLYTAGIILKEISQGVLIRIATFWIRSPSERCY